MSRFLHFLLAAYAPLAARHLLVDGVRTTDVRKRDASVAIGAAHVGVDACARGHANEHATPLAA